MGSSLKQALKGLTATAALLLLVAGPPVALATFVGWPLPAGLPAFNEIAESTRGGIDDMVILKTLAVLGWLTWAQLTLAVSVEAVALARGRQARRAPVLPGLQATAAYLLAAAALLSGAFTSPREVPMSLGAFVRASQTVAATPVAEVSTPSPAPAPATAVSREANGQVRSYTVQHNDSWWEIAESQLGDGLQWQELRARNVGRTMPDGRTVGPDTETIYEGWTLEVPDGSVTDTHLDPAPGAGTEVVVRSGDNLWAISEANLVDRYERPVSDAEVSPHWQDVISRNRDRLVDPDNPDLLLPGQPLLLPSAGAGDHPVDPVPAASITATAEQLADPGPESAPSAVPPSDNPTALDAQALDAASPPPAASVPTERPDPGIEESSDEASDSAPVVGMLGTASTLLAVGISGAVWRRRRRREQQLPRSTPAPTPPEELSALRTEVARDADIDAVDRLRRALGECAAELAQRRSPARPRLVQASDERIEVLLSEPVLPAPTGWRPEASGTAWVRSDANELADIAPYPTHPSLVSLGRQEGTAQLYLDLEAEGLVSITGDDDAVADLARSIVLELSTSPLAAGISVCIVGELDVGQDLDRVRHVDMWDDVADDALSWAEQTRALLAANRWPSPHTARALTDRPDDIAPLVIVVTEEPDDERFAAICSAVSEALIPVVVVAVGVPLEGATLIEVDGEDLRVPALGLSCSVQRVDPPTAEAVERLLTSAEEIPGTAQIPAQLPLITAPSSEDDPPQPELPTDATYVDPPFDVLVRVLGDIEVIGGKQPLSPKQAAVVTFVALHSPTSAERVEDAVWSAPTASRRKRLANTISDARPALGHDHLPAAHDGRYRVGPRVKTDLELFERRLAFAQAQDAESGLETLRGALDLVTGPVFTYRNADRASYAWVDTENWISATELKVTNAAEELAERYLDLGDVDGGVWAAKRGLTASPTHTRLTQLLMRAHFAAGDGKAAERVYESYVSALEQLELDEIDPELAEVYERIRRGTQAAG